MSRVIFKLREPEVSRPTSIIIYYWYDGKRFVASTRRRIHPKDWNERTQRPKRSYLNHDSLTAYLNSLERAIKAKHDYLLAHGRYPTAADFREAIQQGTGKMNIGRPTLTQHLDKLCEGQPAGSLYHRTAALVETFVKAKRMPVALEAVTEEWFDAFQDFLIESKSEGYAYRIARQFKTVIRAAKFDWRGKADVLTAKIKASGAPGEKIYLDIKAVKFLLAVKFEDTRLSDVRYMLVLACLTGLRISDWSKFNTNARTVNSGRFRFVRIVMDKQDEAERVQVAYPPLLGLSWQLLDHLGGNMVPPYWQHLDARSLTTVFNTACKEMTRAVWGEAKVELIRRRKGKTVTEIVPRWTVTSSKIGRLSFNSNLLSLGTPAQFIKVMLGHSTGKDMTSVYDAREFRAIAPQIAPYLEKLEEALEFNKPGEANPAGQ